MHSERLQCIRHFSKMRPVVNYKRVFWHVSGNQISIDIYLVKQHSPRRSTKSPMVRATATIIRTDDPVVKKGIRSITLRYTRDTTSHLIWFTGLFLETQYTVPNRPLCYAYWKCVFPSRRLDWAACVLSQLNLLVFSLQCQDIGILHLLAVWRKSKSSWTRDFLENWDQELLLPSSYLRQLSYRVRVCGFVCVLFTWY